jgi:hypothetical protein
MSHSGYVDARQLPITNFAHKATVVGDDRLGAALAARHMTAERRGAAALDGARAARIARLE